MKGESATVRMITGDFRDMEVCGSIPMHKGQRAIIVTNGDGCFAARLTPSGWVIIDEPVSLYPITGPTQ
jgi:hypothetical protein